MQRTIGQWIAHFEAEAGLQRLSAVCEGVTGRLHALAQQADGDGNSRVAALQVTASVAPWTSRSTACAIGITLGGHLAVYLSLVEFVLRCLQAEALALATVAPLLELAAAGLQRVVLRLLALHRATAKLGYIATSLLAGVVQEGFCTPPEAADGACWAPEDLIASFSLFCTNSLHDVQFTVFAGRTLFKVPRTCFL